MLSKANGGLNDGDQMSLGNPVGGTLGGLETHEITAGRSAYVGVDGDSTWGHADDPAGGADLGIGGGAPCDCGEAGCIKCGRKYGANESPCGCDGGPEGECSCSKSAACGHEGCRNRLGCTCVKDTGACSCASVNKSGGEEDFGKPALLEGTVSGGGPLYWTSPSPKSFYDYWRILLAGALIIAIIALISLVAMKQEAAATVAGAMLVPLLIAEGLLDLSHNNFRHRSAFKRLSVAVGIGGTFAAWKYSSESVYDNPWTVNVSVGR